MAIRSSVLCPDEDKANFCYNELELSTDDISVQGESQWTEVLPSTQDRLDPKGSLKSLSKSKTSPRPNLRQKRKPTNGLQTLLPHAISVSSIESLLVNKESAVKNTIKASVLSRHPLEIPESTTETEGESDASSDEDRREHIDSSHGQGSRDLRNFRSICDPPHRLRIIDARPMMNAKGNALMGKGHEIIGRLGGDSCTTLDFADIPNIHVVRDSLGALRQIISEGSGNPNWFQLVHDTKWLLYISLILKGAIRVALHLESGEPVLIHCSDGWDRTSQLTALAQLILSPYYRTIEGIICLPEVTLCLLGFKSLICKDFNSFGHMFRQRSGSHDPHEYSPVFVQFLDCVWQIWRQFPWEFEFTDQLLLTLVYAVVSRYSEDFIFDHDQQRLHHHIVWRKIMQENNCPHCQRQRREKLGSFGTAISREEQSIRDSEMSLFSDTSTWKSVGGVGTSPSPWKNTEETDPEEGVEVEQRCGVCSESFAKSSTSIWNHVAHNLDAFLNPIYAPSNGTLSSTSAEGMNRSSRDFFSEKSEPIFFGGPYHSALPSKSRPRSNTASDQDLGIRSHLPSHRSHLPRYSSDFDGLERLYGDFSPPIAPLGLDGGDLLPEGISLPKQLFIKASQAHQLHQRPSSVPEGSHGTLRADGEPLPLSETPESPAKIRASTLTDESQAVFFLLPSFDLQNLAIWESAYFSGIPTLKSFTSPSAAFTRGILASRNEVFVNHADLLQRNKELETRVAELHHQISLLQQHHSSINSSTHDHHQSSKGFDDFDMLEGDDLYEAEDSESRIIFTGTLFEDYIPPSQSPL